MSVRCWCLLVVCAVCGASAGEVSAESYVDPNDLTKRHYAMMKECYHRALKEQPGLKWSSEVVVKEVQEGRVEVELRERASEQPELEACIKKRLGKTRLPASAEHDGEVIYKVYFSPPDQSKHVEPKPARGPVVVEPTLVGPVKPAPRPVIPERSERPQRKEVAPGPTTLTLGAPEVSGVWDRVQLERVFVQRQAALIGCHRLGLRRDAKIEGELVVSFEVGDDGRAKGVKIKRSELGAPDVEVCVTRRVSSWRFGSAPKGSRARVVYPMRFGL
jgi:TonB family protein